MVSVLRPSADSRKVRLPATLDITRRQFGLTSGRIVIAAVILVVWLLLSILICFTNWEVIGKILFIVISFIAVELLIRFCVLQESHFMQVHRMFRENGNTLAYSYFWSIYDITKNYIPICRFRGGLNAVFVRFERGVVVGRPDKAEYLSYEAIASAYRQCHRRGLSFMHIDYMDVVGKDTRIDTLLAGAGQTENPELRNLLLRVFDGVKAGMQRSYASYDVYVFYYRGKDEVFLDNFEGILDLFLEANYCGYTMLGSEGLSDLFRVLTSASDFSPQSVNEAMLRGGSKKLLTPIWYEDDLPDGKVHREIINLTSEERAEKQGVAKADYTARKTRVSRRAMREMEDLGEISLDGAPIVHPPRSGQSRGKQRVKSEKRVREETYMSDDFEVKL